MKRVRIAVVLFAAASSTAQANPGCIYTDSYLFTNPSYLGGLIGTNSRAGAGRGRSQGQEMEHRLL